MIILPLLPLIVCFLADWSAMSEVTEQCCVVAPLPGFLEVSSPSAAGSALVFEQADAMVAVVVETENLLAHP